eukprot:3683722-Amphidinium_carterae.1
MPELSRHRLPRNFENMQNVQMLNAMPTTPQPMSMPDDPFPSAYGTHNKGSIDDASANVADATGATNTPDATNLTDASETAAATNAANGSDVWRVYGSILDDKLGVLECLDNGRATEQLCCITRLAAVVNSSAFADEGLCDFELLQLGVLLRSTVTGPHRAL